MKLYNTPQLRTQEITKPELMGKELLLKLEDDYSNYRDDCNEGYCKLEPEVVTKFKIEIANVKESIKIEI